jgi:hypothetical protein
MRRPRGWSRFGSPWGTSGKQIEGDRRVNGRPESEVQEKIEGARAGDEPWVKPPF